MRKLQPVSYFDKRMAIYQRQEENLLVRGTKALQLTTDKPMPVSGFQLFYGISTRFYDRLEVALRPPGF